MSLHTLTSEGGMSIRRQYFDVNSKIQENFRQSRNVQENIEDFSEDI
jgi:hypothetical protein